VYDATIETLKKALEQAKVGHTEKIKAFKRLDKKAYELEKMAKGPDLARIVKEEWKNSPEFGGKTVSGFMLQNVCKKTKINIKIQKTNKAEQLSLF
jgi:hypothetical protein